MAQTTYSDTELLTEHFGYPPVSLLDDIINSINILAERALNSVEQGLLNAPPATLGFKLQPRPAPATKSRTRTAAASSQDDASASSALSPEEQARHEIENGTHQLETLLCASIDRNFDKFELYVMRNILTVRPEDRAWMRLGHYEGLDFTAAAAAKGKVKKVGDAGDDDRPSLESINALRRKLLASQRLNALLHAEKARNDALLAELAGVLGGAGTGRNGDAGKASSADFKQEPAEHDAGPAPLSFLRHKGTLTEGDAERPLTTTTAFALSQLQALRALSASLQNILPDLKTADAGQGAHGVELEGKKSWRSDRLEYIESATRRHLENVRGLDLGKSGEVADGEWQGEGRKIGPGEVESLERVAAMFGRPGESKEDKDQMDET